MYELRNARTGVRLTRCKYYSEIEREIEVIKAVEGLDRKDIDIISVDGCEEAQREMLAIVRDQARTEKDPKIAIVKIRAACDMLSIKWWLDTVQRLTLTVDALDQFIRWRASL